MVTRENDLVQDHGQEKRRKDVTQSRDQEVIDEKKSHDRDHIDEVDLNQSQEIKRQ